MTTIIKDLQKQEPGSARIELFEVEVSSGEFEYFHPGVDESFGSIQFRDRLNPSTIRTYRPLPIEFTGFEASSEGTSNRPRITFANVLSSFSTLLGISNDDLIGKKLIRRRTLAKYLVGNPGDSSPPVEYAIQSYIIDRKETETNLGITFELASPFDLDTIKIPRRQVIPNACNWIYQGAGTDLQEKFKKGGCTWRKNSSIYDSNGNPTQIFFDRNDSPCVSISTTVANSSAYANPVALNNLYYTDIAATRKNLNGTLTSTTKRFFWQSRIVGTSNTPSFSNSQFRLVRNYTTWLNTETYFAYKEGLLYSDIVLHDNHLWACKVTNSSIKPGFNNEWERIDLCGKRLNSCAVRFGASISVDNLPNIATLNKELPYGGFPSSRTLEN